MIELQFRSKAPIRTYSGKVFSNYRAYKDFLERDFNERCGYTDCPQFWFGGKRNFQIDHFMPRSSHSHLANTYSNLVYSSSHVNRAKSDDIGDYIDPCDTDYNEHFYRDSGGNIFPKESSAPAKYMYKKLKLYLKRYGIIWTLDQLEQRMFRLQQLIEATGDQDAKELFVSIGMKYNNYKRHLKAVQ
jgi:hypothetical protein